MSPQVRARTTKRRSASEQQAPSLAARRPGLSPALGIPLTFVWLLAALGLLSTVREVPTLRWSFWGAAAVLLAWSAGLFVTARRDGRLLSVEVSLRKQHYLQACAHLSIFFYWGAYWERVHDAAPLIAAQLVFAYASTVSRLEFLHAVVGDELARPSAGRSEDRPLP